MGTRIDSKSPSSKSDYSLDPVSGRESGLTEAQSNLSKSFLKDRFENRDPANLLHFQTLSQTALEEITAKKTFELMLEEKVQTGCDFTIALPTNTVAKWWCELAELIDALPTASPANVFEIDTQTGAALTALAESAPHRKIIVGEYRL